MSSYDTAAAAQLLGRPYKGIPFEKVQYEVVADSSSLQQSYCNFQLADCGLGQAIIDLDDEGSEICLIADIRSSNPSAPYTGAETIVPKAGGFLNFVDHVEASFVGGEYTINDPQGSACYLLGPKLAIEETTQYTLSMNPSLCAALDTSPSLTGSFTPNSTTAASYSGIGSSQTVNGGIALRNAMFAQKSFFNAPTASWRCEIHLPLRHLHTLCRGVRYGLPIQTFKVWYNTGQVVMPVTVQGGAAPIISYLGSGFNTFRYRKMTPTSQFEASLHEHLTGKTEMIKFLRPVSLPGVLGTTSSVLNNINLGSIPNAERLWVFVYPSGSQLSATSLAPYMLNTAMNQVMIRCGGEQLYDRQLALQNGLGQPEYSEIFRLLQESMPADPFNGRPAGQFGLFFWSIANRYNVFPINEKLRMNAGQSVLFQAVIAQDTQAGAQGLAPSSTNPVDVYFIAEATERVKVTYRKLAGLLTPIYERV